MLLVMRPIPAPDPAFPEQPSYLWDRRQPPGHFEPAGPPPRSGQCAVAWGTHTGMSLCVTWFTLVPQVFGMASVCLFVHFPSRWRSEWCPRLCVASPRVSPPCIPSPLANPSRCIGVSIIVFRYGEGFPAIRWPALIRLRSAALLRHRWPAPPGAFMQPEGEGRY